MTTRQQSLPEDGSNLAPEQPSLPLGERDHDPTMRASTGITDLDEILYGGLISRRAYLVSGGPGSGKTTFGLHFLTAGLARGERVLFITFGEAEAELRANAHSLGFDLAQMHFLDLSPNSAFFTEMQTYDIFSSAEVEHEPITQQILAQVESLHPQRVFLDSMTQFRYLAPDSFQFRKQVLALVRFLVEQGATILLTSEAALAGTDDDLQFMSDGVLHLHSKADGRCLSVGKFRGSDFRGGEHTIRLTDHGMRVFPRLIPEEHRQPFARESIPSGVPELDALLKGGLERGTVSILTGPTGVGKTTLGVQFMKQAAERGERSVIYAFEEVPETLIQRCEALALPVRAMVERGTLSVVPIEPLRLSADEFAHLVRTEVEQQHASVVMIDSVAGYNICLRGEDAGRHLRGLCKYLQNMGVAVVLVNEVHTITGDLRISDVGISYLADTIIFLRYLELKGEIRKVIGVLKKRLSNFERSLREIDLSRDGIKVGPPLTHLQGILTGNISFTDDASKGE
ncbi:MAG TPA: ATPase domain-containing protein [Ktedonobacteraceae bacterium]